MHVCVGRTPAECACFFLLPHLRLLLYLLPCLLLLPHLLLPRLLLLLIIPLPTCICADVITHNAPVHTAAVGHVLDS